MTKTAKSLSHGQLLTENLQTGAIRRAALVAERFLDEPRPPIVLRVEMPVLIERRPGAVVNLLGSLDRSLRRDALPFHRSPTDLCVQHLVRPVVVVEVRRKRVSGFHGG